MGYDITAYIGHENPGDPHEEPGPQVRQNAIAYLRASYMSKPAGELFAALRWKNVFQPPGRWFDKTELDYALIRITAIQESELKKPRNMRQDLNRIIEFLETCIVATTADDAAVFLSV